MAKSSSISLLLVCSTPAFEARKLLSLKKGEVSTVVESLGLTSLPKGLPPPHSSSGEDNEGHAVVNINGRLFTLHHLPSINGRMLSDSGESRQVLELITLLRFMVIILCQISFSFMGNVVIVLYLLLLHLLD